MNYWQLQDAKKRFSEVVDKAVQKWGGILIFCTWSQGGDIQ